MSHPGAVAYENTETGERIGWRPTRPAAAAPGASPDLAGPAPHATLNVGVVLARATRGGRDGSGLDAEGAARPDE